MKTIILLLSLLSVVTLHGQDYHHWSEHYGARASLMGGAATSGLGDNATVYYNPAAMAFVDKPSLSITVNAYRYRTLKMQNALGDGLDLKGSQFATMPNLIAGVVKFDQKPKLRLGYAVITRRNFSSKFDHLHKENYEILSSTAGDEIFVGSYNLSHSLNEYWAGFGVSYQISKSLSIGFSHYGIYRDVKYSNSYEMNVLPEDGSTGDVTSVSANISLNYWNIKGIFKPAISFQIENFKLGISGTTPSFNMLGKANVYRDYSIINMNEVIGTDVTALDRADGVNARHREFGSLAVGVSWRLGKKAWLHWTNETFFGGKYYLLFNPEQVPNSYPTTLTDEELFSYFGNQNFLAMGEESVSRTNFGIGLEAKIAKTWELYLGARTDFLYNEQPYYLFSRIGIEASKWNLYHFSLGLSHMTKKHKRYTVGLEYGLAPKTEFYHIVDFTTPRLDNGLAGDGGRGAFGSQHSFKLLLEIVVFDKNNQ